MQAAKEACEKKLADILPNAAARGQLQRALCPNVQAGSRDAAGMYQVVKWLSSTAKRSGQMQMLQSWSVHRVIGAAQLEGCDVFAACKRALLLCEDESLINAENKELEHWMSHIVEAVESGNFEDSLPAWFWLAEHDFLDDGGIRWIFELAHSLCSGSLRSVKPLLNQFPTLHHQAQTYADTLKSDPRVGQYSEGSVKEQDVRRLLSQCGGRS